MLAGGSNVVVADDGFPGTVVRIVLARRARGRARASTSPRASRGTRSSRAAVGSGLSGVECLAGIPGSVGATPIQNVGAYGQEVAETIVSVRAYDRTLDDACSRSARPSAASRTARARSSARPAAGSCSRSASSSSAGPTPSRSATRSSPGRWGSPRANGRRSPTCATRCWHCGARKGMVIDPADPDSVSAGSFFTNPVLGAAAFAELEERTREWLGDDVRVPRFEQPDGSVKISAAWLIERAGFARGYGDSGDRRDLGQAHARADQSRRGHDRAARRAGARDRDRGARSGSASGSCPSRSSSGTSGAQPLSRAGSGPRTRRARPAAARAARRPG